MHKFDIEAYYLQAKSGNPVNNADLLAYIRSFKHVVLWGASYLGQAIGEKLLSEGIHIQTYWDLRSEQIGFTCGIPVGQPFSGDFLTSETLVILCVGNYVIKPSILKQLRDRNYFHLEGDTVFMGLVCRANLKRGIDPESCIRAMTCRFIYCERLASVVQNRVESPFPEDKPLFLHSITLVVNSICSLKCKFCTSYMPAYSPAQRKNYPTSRIVDDVHRFFSAVDGVGTVTVMGGEPFLHPGLADAIEALLSHPNCGLISISTSATCRMDESILDRLRDPRVNISFSNYTASLNDQQKSMFENNLAKVRAMGLPHTVGVETPQWIVPSTLYDRHLCEEELRTKKNICTAPPRAIQLKNGKVHPCDFANAVYHLEVADCPSDYVDVECSASPSTLRANLHTFMDAPFYRVCGRCDITGEQTAMAGEQGFQDFLTDPHVCSN